MDDRHLVAGNVRAALARAGIRANHLPRLVGGSQSFWSRRLVGEQAFDVDELSALADLLGMDLREFFAPAPRYTGPHVSARSSMDRASDYGSEVRVLSLRSGTRRHPRALARMGEAA